MADGLPFWHRGYMIPAHPIAAWRGRPIRGVLFDLDGTLLDTAADIAQALNRTLDEYGIEPFPVGDVTRMIGRGSPMLIERAAAARRHPLSDADRDLMVQRFFAHYGALEGADESEASPYPGVLETLPRLHAAGLKLAVVTNKQHRFASALLHRLGMSVWLSQVVGGDTCERRKPDPQPLLFACRELSLSPADVLMIGDSINDVKAARGATIPVLCVPYGYNEGEDPRLLPCDGIIDTLDELPRLLWPA